MLRTKSLFKTIRELRAVNSSKCFSEKLNTSKDDKYNFDEIDLWLEKHKALTLSSEKRELYEKFLKLTYFQKLPYLIKIYCREIKKFIDDELLLKNFFDQDKVPNDKDIFLIWEFNKKEDLEGWMTFSDKTVNRGNSTSELTVNNQGRLLFSGNIDSENLPKDGKTLKTGFAHLLSPIQVSAFGSEKFYDWSMFNHIIVRYRGDGRAYRLILRITDNYKINQDSFYEYILFTHGGPYWQTAKVPFSKFVLTFGGKYQEQELSLPRNFIRGFNIMVQKANGPFKLEISHIALQLDLSINYDFDYETYYLPQAPI